MRFVNRENELSFLQSEYQKSESSLVVVYGRRRIGKTCLINEFLRGKRGVYFLATEESESQNIKAFQTAIAEFTADHVLAAAVVSEWGVLFKALLRACNNERVVIVIDEFQYLSKGNAAFPSVFQKIWDTLLKNENCMVILCGSLITMMTGQLLTYGSPLYGRRTGQIKLKQIAFKEYHAFFPSFTARQRIEFYAVTGGVPRYIEMFAGESDIFTAVEKLVVSRQSYLYDEPHYLLQHEVHEIGSYFSIIRSIAAGNHKISTISADIAVNQTNLPKYLKTLIDLDIIERQVPVTENNPEKSKMGLYRITDNFIAFWFTFVYPQKSRLEQNNTAYVMDMLKKTFVERHVAFVYEDICRAAMWTLAEKGNFTFARVGRWWNKNTEIDIIALNDDTKDIIFGECKYTASPMDTDIWYDLLEKKKEVPWNKEIRNESFVFFSMNGFTRRMHELAQSRADIILVEGDEL